MITAANLYGPHDFFRVHVVAETFVSGPFEDVGNEGFRRLVAYIGGANRSRSEIAKAMPGTAMGVST